MPKIKSSELEKIIAEEIEKVVLEEGVFSQVGAGLKGAASALGGALGGAAKQVKGAFQQGMAAKKDQEQQAVEDEKMLRRVALLIHMAEEDPELSRIISNSGVYGSAKLEEAYADEQIYQTMKKNGVTAEAAKKLAMELGKYPKARKLLRMAGLDSMIAKEPAAQQQSQEEPTQVIPSQADQTQVDQTQVNAPGQQGGKPPPKEIVLRHLSNVSNKDELVTARDLYIAYREKGQIPVEDAAEIFHAYLDAERKLLNI